MAESPSWAAAGAAPRLDPARARTVLIVLAGMALMVTYVETMVVPAVVRFQIFFDDPPFSTVAWILSAYLLVGVATTPIFAKLGDLYGKKRIFVLVMSVYAAAVTFAGFTPDIGDAIGMTRANEIYLLIAARGVQGVGLAMFPLAFAMIGEAFPPERMGTAQGIVSAMFAAGATIGLLGGAAVTQAYGWRTTYHTVVPFAIALVVLTVLILRESPVRLRQRLDIPGSLFLGGALGSFLTAISEGPYWGWGDWSGTSLGGVAFGVPELLVLALGLTVAFLLWEPRVPNPVVDFARLRQRNIWISNVVGVIAGVAMFIVFVTNSVMIQLPYVGLGDSVLISGVLSAPTSLSMMLLAPVIGRAIARIGPKPLMIGGSLLVVLGGLALAATTSEIVPGTTIPVVAFTTIPVLVGVVACFIAMTNIIVLSSRREETGIQNGMNATFRTLGQSLGPVIAATFLGAYTTVVHPFGPAAPGLTLPSTTAFEYGYLTAAALGAVSAVLCLFLVNYRFRADGTRHDEPRPGVAPASGGIAAEAGPAATSGAR